jgi:hypothetical protein
MSKVNHSKRAKNHKQRSIWPLAILVAGGLLLILGAFVAFSRYSEPGTPSLKVDKEKVDLGDVKLGQTVRVSFQIANAGDKALRFSKEPYVEVKDGC